MSQGTLRISLSPDLADLGLVMSCEVIDRERGAVDRVVLGPDPVEVEVAAGDYAVRAFTPTGGLLTTNAEVVGDAAPVVVELGTPAVRQSRPDTGGTRFVTGGGEGPELADSFDSGSFAVPHGPMMAPRGDTFEVSEPGAGTAPRSAGSAPSGSQTLSVQLWLRDEPIALDVRDDDPSPSPDGRIELEVQLDPGPFALGVAGERSAARVVCLPAHRNPRVRLSVDPSSLQREGEFNDGLRVEVATGDPAVEALTAYLRSGQLDQAATIGAALVQRASMLFASKMSNPDGAAIAGYYLLRLQETERLHDWPRNFANWFPWLPDAHVILAWHLLDRVDVPDIEQVRSHLLDAVVPAVPPRYTEGLRLLYDGLRMLAARDPDDTEVSDALRSVERYARAADFSSVLTTFWATSPGQPTTEPVRTPLDTPTARSWELPTPTGALLDLSGLPLNWYRDAEKREGETH